MGLSPYALRSLKPEERTTLVHVGDLDDQYVKLDLTLNTLEAVVHINEEWDITMVLPLTQLLEAIMKDTRAHGH